MLCSGSAVLAGTARRISSTHRVTELEGNTFDGLEAKCAEVIGSKAKLSGGAIKRAVQLMAELEVLGSHAVT